MTSRSIKLRSLFGLYFQQKRAKIAANAATAASAVYLVVPVLTSILMMRPRNLGSQEHRTSPSYFPFLDAGKCGRVTPRGRVHPA
jgi:hypothetical protein